MVPERSGSIPRTTKMSSNCARKLSEIGNSTLSSPKFTNAISSRSVRWSPSITRSHLNPIVSFGIRVPSFILMSGLVSSTAAM
jgi:hypothetical protein